MDNNIDSAWAAITSILKEFDFHEIKEIIRISGGIDLLTLNRLGYDDHNWNKEHKGILIEGIESNFLSMNNLEKHKFLNYVIEGIFERINNLRYLDYDPEERLKDYLSRFGWQCIDNKIIPIEILDSVDLTELDPLAREDLIKASTKFRDDDMSGAISSACAAIDSVTANVYLEKSLGPVNKSSFQERCNKSLEAVGIFEAIQNQLEEIQWKNSNVTFLKQNLKQSIKQAAFVMQTLRSEMSDVHGTKPVIKPLVFDSIKWAQIIVRLLSEKYDD
jgi:hypothetical protein